MLLPKEAVPDIQAFVGLSSSQLAALCKLLKDRPKGRADDIADISRELVITEELAQSVYNLVSFCLQRSDLARPIDYLNEMGHLLASTGKAPTKLLPAFSANHELLLKALTPAGLRKRDEKVRFLLYGAQKTVDSVRSICDVRPVFLETEDDEVEDVVGHVYLVRLLIESSDSEGNKELTSLALSPYKLEDFEECIARAKRKVAKIQETYGREVDDDETDQHEA